MKPTLSRIRVAFADDYDHVFVGYTTGRTWNGFACPLLPLAEFTRVLATLVKWGDEASYEVLDDRRVQVNGGPAHGNDTYVMTAEQYATPDGDVWLFDCGGSWTFIEALKTRGAE